MTVSDYFFFVYVNNFIKQKVFNKKIARNLFIFFISNCPLYLAQLSLKLFQKNNSCILIALDMLNFSELFPILVELVY